jgi:hypothetical protein
MEDEFYRIWKEAVVAYSRYYPSICLEGMKKAIKHLSQGSWYPAEIRTKRLLNTNGDIYL